MPDRAVRLCLFGKSCVGKSTTASLVEQFFASRGRSVVRLKLAAPLYELQEAVLRVAGIEAEASRQDQILLESLARHLRRLNSESIVQNFERRLSAHSECQVVINDDLRDVAVDYPRMRRLGFHFIHVRCEEELRLMRLRSRGDLSIVEQSETTGFLEQVTPDAVIRNEATLTTLEGQIADLLARYS